MALLRRFVLVGAVSTAVDLIALALFVEVGGWQVWVADAAAVMSATLISWVLHGLVTFPADPSQRWYRQPGLYLSTAAMALIADVVVLAALNALFTPALWPGLMVLKLLSLAVAFSVRVVRYRSSMFVAIRGVQSTPVGRPPAGGLHRLSVVVPAYMESDRIGGSVGAIRLALGEIASNGGLQIVVVDDGSTDDTEQAATEAGADLVVRHRRNQGKGAAVRTGVLAAGGRCVAFIDADLSYSPDQILRLLEGVEAGWDVVVGSRRHVDTRTVVRARRLRELGGRAINLLTAVVLLGGYRDTQCGLKAMRSDAAAVIFGHSRISGFAFDVEVFALVERYRLSLLELPVEVANSERSTVHVVRDATRLIIDLFRIRRFARLGHYELAPGDAPTTDPGA